MLLVHSFWPHLRLLCQNLIDFSCISRVTIFLCCIFDVFRVKFSCCVSRVFPNFACRLGLMLRMFWDYLAWVWMFVSDPQDVNPVSGDLVKCPLNPRVRLSRPKGGRSVWRPKLFEFQMSVRFWVRQNFCDCMLCCWNIAKWVLFQGWNVQYFRAQGVTLKSGLIGSEPIFGLLPRCVWWRWRFHWNDCDVQSSAILKIAWLLSLIPVRLLGVVSGKNFRREVFQKIQKLCMGIVCPVRGENAFDAFILTSFATAMSAFDRSFVYFSRNDFSV